MTMHLFSDLHLEHGPIEFSEEVRQGAWAELVLLAGDINVKRRAVVWAASVFSQPTVIVGGNHVM
jgi:predicted phosphodiesterase